MIVISHNRNKCIGCNYCVEEAEEHWKMSDDDGKSILVGSVEKKGQYILRLEDDQYDVNQAAAETCPVNVINVKQL